MFEGYYEEQFETIFELGYVWRVYLLYKYKNMQIYIKWLTTRPNPSLNNLQSQIVNIFTNMTNLNDVFPDIFLNICVL